MKLDRSRSRRLAGWGIAAGLTGVLLVPAVSLGQQQPPPRPVAPRPAQPRLGVRGAGQGARAAQDPVLRQRLQQQRLQRMRAAAGFSALGLDLRGLNLSPEQRQQLRALVDQHREGIRTAQQRAAEARRAMNQAVGASPVDEAAIRTRSTEAAQAEAEAAILRARFREEAMRLLTPAQLEQLRLRRERALQRLELQRQRLEQQRQRLDEQRQRLQQRRNG